MVRSLTLSLALLVATGLAAQQSEDLTVHFPLASAQLNSADEAALRALCDRADIARVTGITLRGHTDVRGSLAYNEALSERRAEAVRAALGSTCLRDATVVIDWSGETEPIALGESENEHASNRRVEVELLFGDAQRELDALLRTRRTITPLMPQADVRAQRFTVDPSRPIEFVASDGVRVRIAANAIVSNDGCTVQGPVEISYRSFNNAWESIASGIPMHVGTGVDAGHMESMGMYEVYAAQRGQQLSLRDGEVISLTKPTAEVRTADYRDWMLDENTGTWSEVASTTSMAPSPTYRNALTAAVSQYMSDMERMPDIPDTTHFLTRLASNQYCHLTPCFPTGMPYSIEGDRLASPYSDKNIPAIQVGYVRDAYKWRSVTGFRIQLTDDRAHTEWLAFPKDMVWAYNGPLSKRKFNQQIARRHFYQDIFFRTSEDGTSGVIRLKDQGTWMELPVDLSYNQSTKRDSADWRMDVNTYRGRFEAKRARFDRRLDEKVRGVTDRAARVRSEAWSDARRVMMVQELAMTTDEFDAYARRTYAEDMSQLLASNAGTVNGISTSFAMRGFGIYNCDQILRREAIEPAEVAVVDPNGDPFRWTMAYGILDGRKAVITYWGNGSGRADNMRLSKDMTTVLFVGPNGTMLAVDRPGELARSRRMVLTGKPMEQPKNKEELDALAER